MGKKNKKKVPKVTNVVSSSSSSPSFTFSKLQTGTPVSFCLFHHLLEGKSHKKEKELVSEARSIGCDGLIIYGTPGIIITDASQDDVKTLMSAARKIGKKGDVTQTLYHANINKEHIFKGGNGKLSSASLQDVKKLLGDIHASHGGGALDPVVLAQQFKAIVGM
jgi:hypothetical protein